MSGSGAPISVLRGGCPAPFFNAASFPATGGFLEGRLCQDFVSIRCCLPCPLVDYVYPDNFSTLTNISNWLSVVGTLATVFLLLSWIFLPAEKTNRHYLSISLAIAIAFMNMGFIIPLAAKPEQCLNQITPNDMRSSPVCAASGTFLLLGGWGAVVWVFIRMISLHLQICWQVVVGKKFMIWSHVVGWGIPVTGVIIALLLSGVSFRFGATCHINHENSLAAFWIPLLVFAGITVIVTFTTFGYCLKVYLASLSDNSTPTNNSGLPKYSGSVQQALSPRQAYRQIKQVIKLQWRGIAIVLIIVADVIFFSLIFVFQDNTFESVQTDAKRSEAWVRCLVLSLGDKNQCLHEARTMVIDEVTVTAVLILLALNGIWLLLFIGRFTIVTAWIDFIRGKFTKSNTEFVSFDAQQEDQKKSPRSYEMLSRDPGNRTTPISPTAKNQPVVSQQDWKTPDYFGSDAPSTTTTVTAAARYQPPARSFSNPRPPLSVVWSEKSQSSSNSIHQHRRDDSMSSPVVGGLRPPPNAGATSNTTWNRRGSDISLEADDDRYNGLGINRI